MFVAREEPGFGKALFASAPIKAGTVVIAEEPLLAVDGSVNDKESRQAAKLAMEHAMEPALLQCLLDFCRAPAAVQSKVLDMFAPSPEDHAESKLVCFSRAAAALARQLPACAGTSQDTLLRVALVFQINSHRFRDSTALFELGSKLNHSCDANTDYHSVYASGGKAYHVANRDIAEGEMLTTDYLQTHALASTAKRRQLLATQKLFHCNCSRCTTQPDQFRRLPCPACAPRDAVTGMLAEPLKFGALDQATSTFTFDSSVCSRYITCHMTEVEAGAAEPWHCAACGATFAARPAALFPPALLKRWGPDPELRFEEQVEEFDSMMDHGREPSLPAMKRLYKDICGVLGCQHWLLHKLARIQIEYRCQDIKYKPMAGGGFLAMMGSQLGSTPTGAILSDMEHKTAMLWAWGTALLQQRNFPYHAYNVLGGAVEKLVDASTAPWATPAERVRAAEIAGNLCQRSLRALGVEQRCLDFQGFKCQQLLVQWGRLTKMVRDRDAETFWVKAYKPVWRELLGAGAPAGRLRPAALHLFKDAAEKKEFANWLKEAAGLKG